MTDAVQISIEDGLAAYDLFSYVGDHGGGERYPNGDCPDQREAPCPSCDANRLAAVFKRALDATDDYDEDGSWLPL